MKPTSITTWTAVLLAVVVCVAPAAAIRIELNFVNPGEAFDAQAGVYALEGPDRYRGSGNVHDIMREAADIWQRALPSEGTVRVDYGWRSIGNYEQVAQHNSRRLTFDGSVTRNARSWISFDPGYDDWYLDPDPSNDDEYRDYDQSGGWYNGRNLNDERRFSDPRTWEAGGLDLLTLALHELGHALGWTGPVLADYRSDTGRRESDGVRIADDLPGAGAVIHYDGTHPDDPDTLLMSPLLRKGTRELPTVADILTVASISRWPTVERGYEAIREGVLDPDFLPILELPAGVPFGVAVPGIPPDTTSIPEPGVLVLFASGLALTRPGWRRP